MPNPGHIPRGDRFTRGINYARAFVQACTDSIPKAYQPGQCFQALPPQPIIVFVTSSMLTDLQQHCGIVSGMLHVT